MLCDYCSIKVKRQSELSGLRPDTSSLVAIGLPHALTNETDKFIILLRIEF